MKIYLLPLILLCSLVCLPGHSTTILFLGDSITDGYGVSDKEGYPQKLKNEIKDKLKKEIKIINASESGSTTSSGLTRLNWILRKKSKIDILVLALGGNDGLRGIGPNVSKKNLKSIIEKALQKEVKVVLAGMLIPPNYGPDYTKKFKEIYSSLSTEYKRKITFIPFLLKGVGGRKDLNLPDGIHPNEKGHLQIMKTIYPHIVSLL